MESRYTHRRAVLKAVGAGIVGTAVVGSASASQDAQSLNEQLETVREATESFTDARRAMESGFRIMGPPFRQMGWHFANLENLQQALEGNVDLARPVLLTYSDDLELGAVIYAVSQETQPPDLFTDENGGVAVSEEDAWGRHNSASHVYSNRNGAVERGVADRWANGQLVFEADSEFMEPTNWVEFSPARDGLKPGDTVDARWEHTSIFTERVADIVVTHPPLHLLYVWTHAENPAGVFNPGNPEFNVE